MNHPPFFSAFTLRTFRFGWVLALGFTLPVFAQKSDQQMLEQLYNEIITASSGASIADDTAVSGTKSTKKQTGNPAIPETTMPSINNNAASERLQQEIDRIMNDVKNRHDETVRFMQDAK